MPHNGYSQAQFEQKNLELTADRRKAVQADPAVRNAFDALGKAQSELSELEIYVKTLPMERRLQYNGNVTQAKQAVRDAEKGYREAQNAHIRAAYLAKLEAARQETLKAEEDRQHQLSFDAEYAAKEEFQRSFLAAGGTQVQFEKQWPDIWQKELRERATEQIQAAKRQLNQQHGYNL